MRLTKGKMVPDLIVNLVPPEATKPSVSTSGAQQAIPVPAAAVPKFGAPDLLIPDNFWSNLKQFLTERPVKVSDRPGAPFVKAAFGAGVFDNFKDFFSSRPVPKGPVNSRLAVSWGANFGGFGARLKEAFFPAKLPPANFTSKPVKVKDIWTKDENFGWTQVISFALHGSLFALVILIPLFWHFGTKTEAKNKNVEVTGIDLSPYMAKLPAGAKKAGGGGGANDHTLTPVNKGKLPKFQWTQFTPPQVKPQNPDPKLAMDPSLLGPPDLKVPNINAANFGDPLANGVSDSLGHGNGTGIGSGTGGGLGPGEGGGTGGGAFRAGVNGVGIPECIYCPPPLYSDDARKAKYMGTVVLQVTITPDGRAVNISILKDPGMGLGEKAVESVRTWKFRPAAGPNGKIVAVQVPIEVTFRLY
ncbi:MAG TPA: energy transducer TonB [Candidatus Acidoferrum sp.]|nr:energy transducer TonB [Candidatus Acidoferrum sp.]